MHPEAEVVVSGGAATLRCGDTGITVTVDNADLSSAAATWHPEFGLSLANHVLAARFSGEECTTTIAWRP